MSEIRVNTLGNESNTGGPVLSGITTFSGQQYFIPPTGTTAQRPSGCPPGSIRFNTDSAHLEYWNGLVWLEFEASSEELGDQNNTNSSGGTGHRGVIFGGNTDAIVNTMEFITISTQGNAQDFGDMTSVASRGGALSSRTRGIRAGGQTPSTINTIEFITISSTGNATNFGDLSNTAKFPAPMANETRGVFAGGYTPTNLNTIEFITIASTGDATDFGDMISARNRQSGCSSSTRGLVFGGASPSPSESVEGMNNIEFITMASTGNSQDFGDLSVTKFQNVSVSNATRGVIFGGRTQPNGDSNNVIDFITIATLGNATDFGDDSGHVTTAGVSSPTRGVKLGGRTSPADVNIIEYVVIATAGDAIDFGDLTTPCNNHSTGGASNGHGGL